MMSTRVAPGIGDPVASIDGWANGIGEILFTPTAAAVLNGVAVTPLAVVEAIAVLRSAQGERMVPAVELATGPGRRSIAPDEILTHVIIPKPVTPINGHGEEIAFFAELGPRRAQTIAIASVALRSWLGKEQARLMEVRVALGAVAPTVMLASLTAGCLMVGSRPPTAVAWYAGCW